MFNSVTIELVSDGNFSEQQQYTKLSCFFFSTEDFGLFSILTVGVCHQRNCSFCVFLLLLNGTMLLLTITKPVRHERMDVANDTTLKIVKQDIKLKDSKQLIYTLKVPLNLSMQKEGKTGAFLPPFNFIPICLVLPRAYMRGIIHSMHSVGLSQTL